MLKTPHGISHGAKSKPKQAHMPLHSAERLPDPLRGVLKQLSQAGLSAGVFDGCFRPSRIAAMGSSAGTSMEQSKPTRRRVRAGISPTSLFSLIRISMDPARMRAPVITVFIYGKDTNTMHKNVQIRQ